MWVQGVRLRKKQLSRVFLMIFQKIIFPLLGPLLPENLPVQHMPITKARDLTISLAGKLCYLFHKWFWKKFLANTTIF